MQNTTSSRLYVVRTVPGKGNGLVATETIRKGTRILCEEPIITLPQVAPLDHPQLLTSISQQVDGLSEHQRDIFLSMHNIHPYSNAAERYLGIIRTVSLPMEDSNGNDTGGVFLEASRINHACDNNAQKHWNSNIRRHTVHALRDIEKDEEITVHYIGVHGKREARQAALKAKFNFVCSCRLCSLPLAQRQESDKRLEKILRLDSLIGKEGTMGMLFRSFSLLETLRHVDHLVQLYNKGGLDDIGLPRAYLDAAQIVISNGDLARGRVFFERAVSGWQISQGDDSKDVIENQTLARDLSKHPVYGRTFIWRTAPEDVPNCLDQDSFEDWLWRRENLKPKPATTLGLRSRTAFPSFDGLPDGPDMISQHLRASSGLFGPLRASSGLWPFHESYDQEEDPVEAVVRPRRHWCLLAEIVSVARTLLTLKDIDDKTFHLAYPKPDHGQEVDYGLVKNGHTVAVLYAERNNFMFNPLAGVHLADPSNLKVFPASLNTLLELSDEVEVFSTVQDGGRICHGCWKKGTSMQHCSRCSLFWYCGKECQKTGWKVKDHKSSCELLKDQDLRGLLTFEWDKFEDYIKFPLGA